MFWEEDEYARNWNFRGWWISGRTSTELGSSTREISTVILCDRCSPCGVDIRGGDRLLKGDTAIGPWAASTGIHALVLSGGSAFGLDAAGGVMRYLEEREIGFDVGVTKVPLVCQSCVFDLAIGRKEIRPDARWRMRHVRRHLARICRRAVLVLVRAVRWKVLRCRVCNEERRWQLCGGGRRYAGRCNRGCQCHG